MKLLVIDTCDASGTIALADAAGSGAIVATATLPGRSASERLIPAIQHLLSENVISLPSLAAIAVVHGPGSFTGVRIGLSAAKGLCEALGIPLIAISRLAVLASLAPASPRTIALLDAGRGEFYVGEYMGELCCREALLTREELIAAVPGGTSVIACEPVVASALSSLSLHLVPSLTAATALPLALRRLHAQSFDDIARIDANYVRRTDAEIFAKPRAAGLPSGTAGS